MGIWIQNINKPLFLLLLIILVQGFIPFQEAAYARSTPELDHIRVGNYTTFSRITLELSSSKMACKVSTLTEKPPVLLVELIGVKADQDDFGKEYKVESAAFKNITFSYSSKKTLLTVPLKENVNLDEIHHHTWNDLVTIDLPLKKPNHAYVPPVEEILQNKNEEKKKVVIIDPGHGGFDPGAGRGYYYYVPRKGRLIEKDVAFDVANRLKRYLEKNSKYIPLLTRYGDYLPVPFGAKGDNRKDYWKKSLYYRVQLAKEYCGDIFVSIHLNSIPGRSRQRQARGFEIYYLGDNYADKMMTADKNQDIAALEALGVDLSNEESMIISALKKDKILYDSKQLASAIIQKIQNVPGVILRPRPIRPNRYIVTKQFLMPSVLVELGFLSNKYDHANFKKTETRKKMASSLYEAIDTFFYKPTEIPLVALESDKKEPSTVSNTVSSTKRIATTSASSQSHKVRRGETLTTIAAKYGITVSQLRTLNRRKIGRRDRIYIGQKLLLPFDVDSQSESKAASSSSGMVTYTVRPNDTLEKIALKFNTTINNLKRLNHIRGSLIYPDDKLKVTPGKSTSRVFYHTVRRGDTLEKIAHKYDTTVRQLKSLNRKRSSLIYPGDKLKIVVGGKYEVASARPINYKIRRGDTLGKIADRFNTSVNRLKRVNGLRSNIIRAGKILQIP